MKGKKIRLFDVINTILLLLLAFVCIYPLYYTVIASFSDYIPVATGEISFWPIDFTTLAYEAILDNKEIWLGYRNTIIYTILGTLFNLFLTVPTAYVMSKKRMFGHTLLTWFFLITMYFSGGMVPTYLLYRNLNLINNPMIMIVTGGLSVYNMIVARTYFSSSIPESLYESVKIDGGSEFDQFFRIALPLSKPVVAVITLYYAVGHWNSYFNAMMYLSNRKYHPLALVLRRILILNESIVSDDRLANMDARILADLTQKANMAVVMKYALVLISSLPLLIAYPFVQKYFVKGVMIGSVKG